MDRLPNEVIGMIVEQYTGPKLARLATISRRWQQPVERRIFREMRFRAWRPKLIDKPNTWCDKWRSFRKLPEDDCTTDNEDIWSDLPYEAYKETENEETDGEEEAMENKKTDVEEEWEDEIIISPCD